MPRKYSMVKREEAAKQTRDRIERALIRALAEKSFAELTMLDIAGRADVSVRTVQRHYASKDDLLCSAMSYWQRAMERALAGRAPQESAPAAIGALVSAVFFLYEAHRGEVWAAYCRGPEVPQLREILLAGVETREAGVQEMVDAWSDAWAAPPEVASATLRALTGYLTWQAFTYFGRSDTSQAAALVSDLLCRALLVAYPDGH